MISLADPTPINSAVVDDGGDLVARVLKDGGWTRWLIGACIGLFAGSALLGQQAQF